MREVLLLFFALGPVSTLQGQQRTDDSLRTYLVQGIVITATRSQISVKDSPTQLDVLDIEDIGNSNGSTVADLLEHSSAIFLKDQGAHGALKTLSLRGTSSDQVLVLVNGSRFNSFQNGLVDLSLLLSNDVERLEIVHGGSSALYGADALGGVLNILTREPGSGFGARAEVSVGSFSCEQHLVEAHERMGGMGLLVGYAVERGRDDFPIHFQNQSRGVTTASRAGDDFTRGQLYLHCNLMPDGRSALELSLQNVNADRGVPGGFSPLSVPSGRQNDNDVNFSASYRDRHVQDVELTAGMSMHYSLETCDEPMFFYNTFYKNIYGSFTSQAQVELDSHRKLIFGGELGQGTLESPDFDSKIFRVQQALYLSSEMQYDYDREVLNHVSLFQTIRYDRVSDVDFAVTPKLGLNIRLLDDGDLRVRSSWGESFHSPTFNDLYYRGYSNPSLEPERATSFDAGLLSEFAFLGLQMIEATYFHLNAFDRIVFEPTVNMPINIGRAVSDGLEVKYKGHFFKRQLEVGINYSLTDARKKNRDYSTDSTFDRQIIYVPRHVLNLSVSVHRNPVTVNCYYNVVSTRFTSEDNLSSLPAYRVMAANLILREPVGGWKFVAKGEIDNIFDTDYENFQGFPMPGRSYRFTLGIEY